jgi:hypothetical protein
MRSPIVAGLAVVFVATASPQERHPVSLGSEPLHGYGLGSDESAQGPGALPPGEDEDVQTAITRACMFLAAAQGGDGAWAAQPANDIAPLRDIGVTALACLALMDAGHDPSEGALKHAVRAGLDWIVEQQQESGLLGERLGHAYLYDHAIATLALAEAHRCVPEAGYGAPTKSAVGLALRARNPYGAWRYDLPPTGDNDTSVTGWMVTALSRAADTGIKVDEQAFVGALRWIDEVTDLTTGRVGYDSVGSRSSRIVGVNETFPPESGEGMTAVGLYIRLLRGQSPDLPVVKKHVALLRHKQPAWDPKGLGTDMYYWYYATRAMHAVGGEPWTAWRASLERAVVLGQDEDGGWPAVGPWGAIGGRNYATALMLSCLVVDRPKDGSREPEPAMTAPPEEPEEPEEPVPDELEEATPVAAAVDHALAWLISNQEQDGHWDLNDFPSKSGAADAGAPIHEVGVTGLALLALLGDGHTLHSGAHTRAVESAVQWLQGQLDVDSGLIGEQVGYSFLYDHAIATAALAEAYRTGPTPLLRSSVQLAVNFILRARNPYGAWRYDVPPAGDNDTSVTAWMAIALQTAESADLKVDEAAYQGALSWISEVTDPQTGRVGYDSMGSASSRVSGINDHFPTDRGEAMTGAGIFVRLLLGDEPDASMRKGEQLLLRHLPEWAPGDLGCDLYYWMHGSNAMHMLGGRSLAAWSAALRGALLPSQRMDGDLAGSWDPVDPWSFAGGRVYATALAALALQNENVTPIGTRKKDQ